MTEQKYHNRDGERTEEIRRYIFAYMNKSCGMSPTIREISEGISGGIMSGTPLSLSLVSYHLGCLSDQGIIERVQNTGGRARTSRGIRIVGARYLLPQGGET